MTYVEAVSWISPCPVYGCVNKGKYYKWVHQGCGGNLKLNIEGKFICTKCNEKRLFKNWRFQCGGHDPEEANDQGASEALKSVSNIMIKKNTEQFISKVTQAIMTQFISEEEYGDEIHEIDFISPCASHECLHQENSYKWSHPEGSCKGKLKLNDEGIVRCVECNMEWYVNKWEFQCPNHNGKMTPSVQGLCHMLNSIGVKLKGNAGQQFIARTTKKALMGLV